MKATVITDASFCDETKAAGWAAWVRIDGQAEPIKRYGSFKIDVATSFEAEALAAINGLWIAQQCGATEVLLQTDCLTVVHIVNGITKSQKILKFWRNARNAANIRTPKIKAKHVKGHTATDDARSYVNRWCDKNAKRSMVAARGVN